MIKFLGVLCTAIVVSVFGFTALPASAASTCTGYSEHTKGSYYGSWTITECTVENGKVTGKVKIDGNGSCSGTYNLRGEVTDKGLEGQLGCGGISGVLFAYSGSSRPSSQWGRLSVFNAKFDVGE